MKMLVKKLELTEVVYEEKSFEEDLNYINGLVKARN
jgi:hypothetical protein